jgi:ubiquinone/menaquinone biosynthesis C-methylase UbiE
MRDLILKGDRWAEAQESEKRFWQGLFSNGYHGMDLEKLLKQRCLLDLVIRYDFDLSFFEDKTVVEIGCGPYGCVSSIVARNRVGVDPLMDYFKQHTKSVFDGLHYVKSVGEVLPFPNDYADVVICQNVLDHTNAPYDCLREINRILKLNGLLVLWVNNYHFIVALIRKNVEKGRLGFFAFKKDVPHPHSFTLSEILRMMRKFGFRMMRGAQESPLKGAEYPKDDTEIRNSILIMLLKILPLNIREHEFRGVFRKIANLPLQG